MSKLMTPEEQRILDLSAEVHMAIIHWGLSANVEELAAATHTVQGFVKQHVLHRLDPDGWSDWFSNDGD